MLNEVAIIERNVEVGPRLYLMTLKSPGIASQTKPGQFVHLSLTGANEHVLRRPFSIYDADSLAGTIDILYQVVGQGSAYMTEMPVGLHIDLIGPVGRGWHLPEAAQRILLVAGGVGAAPLFMLAREARERGICVDVILGAQTEKALVCRERYAALLGAEPSCSTDDGSFGRAGFCTSLVQEALGDSKMSYDYLAVCGPAPLMSIVSTYALEAQVPCEVSMEKRMACGIGACLSCVVDTVAGKKRACVDGPVFDAREVVW